LRPNGLSNLETRSFLHEKIELPPVGSEIDQLRPVLELEAQFAVRMIKQMRLESAHAELYDALRFPAFDAFRLAEIDLPAAVLLEKASRFFDICLEMFGDFVCVHGVSFLDYSNLGMKPMQTNYHGFAR
jgi:hypothetical protein